MDRSHLLQGLRTGGPTRPAPFGAQPLSANPNTTRFQSGLFDDGQSVDAFQQQMNFAMAGPTIQQQQLAMLQAQAQMAALMSVQGGAPTREAQALQMQMEMLRLQALQQQQKNLQAQLMLQSQIAAANQQQQNRRRSEQHQPALASPAIASPITPSGFDAAAAQTARMTAANQLRARAIGREASAINANVAATIPEEQPQQVSPPPSAPVHVAVNRAISTPLNPNAAAFVGRFKPELALAISAVNNKTTSEAVTPATPTYGSTTVISGGTSLGSAHPSSTSSSTINSAGSTPSNSYNGLSGYNSSPSTTPAGPTKSDSAMSWRRPSASSTPTQSNKPPSPPLRQRSTSPPAEATLATNLSGLSISSSNNNSSLDVAGAPLSAVRIRPSPLRFSKAANVNGDENVVATSPVCVSSARSQSPSSLSTEGSNHGLDDAGSNHSGSSPTSSTPPSSAGSEEPSQKKVEREEASKRLYEGLGLGRPVPSPNATQTQFNVHAAPFSLPARAATMPATKQDLLVLPQPHRQPIGPPSSVDELGPRNFASRLRKKALGGLGVLMDARDRREGCVGVEVTAC